jgi:DNA polymerase-3 subunit delta
MGASEKILSELKRGKIYSTYCFLGEDHGSKEEVIARIKKKVFDESETDTGTTIFYGDDTNVSAIIEALTTASIFSRKNLVIVRAVDCLDDTKPLIDYMKSPAQSSVLLLVSEKNFVSKALENAVVKHGRLEIFWPMFQNEGEKWLVAKLKEYGIFIEPDAVKYIIELSGTRIDELNNQVEHIVNFLKEGENLTLEKASKIVSKLYRYTVFDLCNKLFVSSTRDILAIFRYLVTTGEEPVKIEYFISKEIRKLLKAYALAEDDHSFYQIERVLGFRKMESKRVQMILNKVPQGRIKRLYSRLVDLDYTLKSKPKEIGLYVFESLLMEAGV